MQFNFDELTADELEEYAREVYESAAQRNQYPQKSDHGETVILGKTPEIGTPVVNSIAEYTMIPPPDEADTEFANYNGS